MGFAQLDSSTKSLLRRAEVLVPSPLLVDAQGRLLEKQQMLLTEYYARAGAVAVIPGAHTGQFARQDLGLYRAWVELVDEVIGPFADRGAMLRMSAVSGPDAMKMVRIARDANQDIVLVAPSSFGDRDEIASIRFLKELAQALPVMNFYLQPAVGGRLFSPLFWQRCFEFSYGAKVAPFSRPLTDDVMRAAVSSSRWKELVIVTGNDDNIVDDFLAVWRYPDYPDRSVRISGGLLGHFATDTNAAVRLVRYLRAFRDDEDADNPFPVDVRTLAAQVTFMNYVLFDTLRLTNKPSFENSVYGVHRRLGELGLAPEASDIRWPPLEEGGAERLERGRPNLDHEIRTAYAAHPHLTDNAFVGEILPELREKYGV